MNIKRYKVSVWMITYNHEKFIGKALDSILMQNVNFDYNIVVGEDCSTDNTRKILLEYKKKYPDKFELLLYDKNIGITRNLIETYNACEGEYVAMLEGDDFWIDENKLQSQVDFLDNNKDCVLCYTKANIVDADCKFIKLSNQQDQPKTDLKEVLSRGWFMHTGTLLYRNNLIKEFPDFYFKYKSTDYMLHILLAEHGKIGFINIISSSYRQHEGGITKDFRNNIISFLNKKLVLLNEVDEYLELKYTADINILRKNINSQLFIHKLNTRKIRLIFSSIPISFLDRIKSLIHKKVNKLYKYSFPLSTEKKIINLIKNKNIDLIHCNYGTSALKFLNIIKKTKIPFIVHFHGYDASKSLNDKYYTSYLPELFNLSNSIITVSDNMMNNLKTYISKENLRKLVVIPYGTDLQKILKYPKVKKENKKINILHVGRLTPKKGVFDLPQIDNYLKKSGINVKWTIVGFGKDKNELQTKWHNKEVMWLGKLSNDEVCDVYLKNDIIVLPSHAEGFPVVIIEAMKAGIIPLVTDLPSGIPEIIKNGENGFVFPIKSHDKYAVIIEQLSNNRELLNTLKLNAIKSTDENFNPSIQANKYKSEINLLLNLNEKTKYFKKETLGFLDKPFIPNLLTFLFRKLKLKIAKKT